MKLPLSIHTTPTWTIAIMSPCIVDAQPANMMDITPRAFQKEEMTRPHSPPAQAQFDSSFTASGRTEFRGVKQGSSESYSTRLNVFVPLPLSDRWIVPLGLGMDNLFIDSVRDVPLPDDIHTLSFNTGLGHRLNDEWMIMGMVNSTLYKLSEVGGNDLGFSGGINAMWRSNPSVTWRFGLMASPDSDIPVLPMLGVDWQINEKFNLRLLFPQPRLTYQRNERWKFHVGMNMVGSTFRTGESFGTAIGLPQYDDALGTYRDIRVGGGLGYQLNERFTVEAEAGYSVSRQIDYTRIDETVEFDPAPYFGLSLRLGF